MLSKDKQLFIVRLNYLISEIGLMEPLQTASTSQDTQELHFDILAEPVNISDLVNDAEIWVVVDDSGDTLRCESSGVTLSAKPQLPVEAEGAKKKRPTTSLGHFLAEEKSKCDKFDYKAALSKWRAFDSKEKVRYQEMYKEAKIKFGENNDARIGTERKVVKENKQKRDRLRQVKIRKIAKQKQELEVVNIEKMKEMILRKEEKLSEMKNKTDRLELDLLSCEDEIQAVLKTIKESEKSEGIMKEKYKSVYKHHSACPKK